MSAPSFGGFYISQIHEISKRVFNNLMKEHGIVVNPNQGRILFLLWQHDNIPIRVLKDKSGLKKTTLTSVLDGLEDAGFIKREISQSDKREILIKNTEYSRELSELYAKVSVQMTDFTYKGFKLAEIQNFEEMLERVLQNLKLAESKQK